MGIPSQVNPEITTENVVGWGGSRVNVSPKEGSPSKLVQVHPDAIICHIDQLKWGVSMGHREVSLSEPTPNNADVFGHDLIRLAILGKQIISNTTIKASLQFQVHGKS
ncbi:hypothetical protein INT45_006139, partial [Circinella minor]